MRASIPLFEIARAGWRETWPRERQIEGHKSLAASDPAASQGVVRQSHTRKHQEAIAEYGQAMRLDSDRTSTLGDPRAVASATVGIADHDSARCALHAGRFFWCLGCPGVPSASVAASCG